MIDIPGYEGLYKITRGAYIENRFDKEMKQSNHGQGYKLVTLTDRNGKSNTKRVHRLVAETYIPNPDGHKQVNHIDGDKANNRVDNLEWCDQKMNMEHAKKSGLIRSGEDRTDKQRVQDKVNGYNQGKRNRKITPEIAAKINSMYDSGMTLTQVAKELGFGFTSVQRYVKNIRSEAGRFTKGR